MVLRIPLFKKVTIVGVGLIGGSLGLAIKKNRLAREVVGFSQRHTSLTIALKSQAVDQAYQDVKKAVTNADFVILATPVSIIPGMLNIIGPHLKRNCIITDVGSTKASIVSAAEESLPKSVSFVGSHPLAGSEKRGVQHANADLFEKSVCIMTPTNKTNRGARERVKKFWSKIGATTKFLSPEEHDKTLGYISHLPHVLTYALMEAIPSQYLGYGAQGLKDTTRIASSPPHIWNDICLGNSRNVIRGIDEVVKALGVMRSALSVQDQKVLLEHFKIAKNKRDQLG